MVRLNDLKNFMETASCRTMSESARRLGITQPALSESIQRLEADTGTPLFYRSKAGISLTPSGRLVLEKSKSVMGLIDEMKADHEEALPAIVVGCHPVVASYTLPETFRTLQKVEPRYHVVIENHLSRDVQNLIQQGKIDVGIVVNPVANPDLIIRKVAKDRVCVWSHKNGPHKEQVICDPDLFQAQSILKDWKKRPEAMLATRSLELTVRLTQARAGYGIIPTKAVELLGAPLVRVPNTVEYLDEIAVIYRPEFGKTIYEKQIVEAIVQSLV